MHVRATCACIFETRMHACVHVRSPAHVSEIKIYSMHLCMYSYMHTYARSKYTVYAYVHANVCIFVCVRMHVRATCACIFETRMHACVHVRSPAHVSEIKISSIHLCMYSYMHAYARSKYIVYEDVHANVCIFVCIQICTRMRDKNTLSSQYALADVCISVCIPACVCMRDKNRLSVHTHMYVYVYVYVYIYACRYPQTNIFLYMAAKSENCEFPKM